ncbi:MAG: tetratricopeptide repeat protein [Candidatus Heimdallarchaeota archaeon]|nr:tetratricopeptide repeat protein [Candidatus Heimdallarchaeota archaeon]
MTHSKITELRKKVRALRNAGKIEEALTNIDQFEKEASLTSEEKLSLGLDKINFSLQFIQMKKTSVYSLKGEKKLEDFLDQINELLNESRKKGLLMITLEATVLKAQIQNSLGNNNDALKIVAEGEVIIDSLVAKESKIELLKKKARLLYIKSSLYLFHLKENDLALSFYQQMKSIGDDLQDKDIIAMVYMGFGYVFSEKGEFEKAIDYLEKGLAIRTKQEDKVGQAHFLHNIAVIYDYWGKTNKSLEYFRTTLKLRKTLGLPIGHQVLGLGTCLWRIGELDEAKKYLEDGLAKVSESGNKRMIAFGFFALGFLYWRKGELDKGLEYQREALERSKAISEKGSISLSALNLGAIYFDKGEFEEALTFIEEGHAIAEEIKSPYNLGWSYYLLGRFYQARGDNNLALEFANISLENRRYMNNILETAHTLFLLITIAIDRSDSELAESYLTQLQQIYEERREDRIIDHTLRIARALILKASTRPRNWIKAMDILEEIINEETTDNILTIIAMINFCELLLNEFQVSGDKSVVKELDFHTDRLLETAKLQESYLLSLEAYNLQILAKWLKAQFSMVTVDMQKAKELLISTRQMAEESGMLQLAKKISKRQDELLKRLEQWDQFIRDYYEFIKQ